eukprot:2048433-Pleurochrysis_carterae.AAC.1
MDCFVMRGNRCARAQLRGLLPPMCTAPTAATHFARSSWLGFTSVYFDLWRHSLKLRRYLSKEPLKLDTAPLLRSCAQLPVSLLCPVRMCCYSRGCSVLGARAYVRDCCWPCAASALFGVPEAHMDHATQYQYYAPFRQPGCGGRVEGGLRIQRLGWFSTYSTPRTRGVRIDNVTAAGISPLHKLLRFPGTFRLACFVCECRGIEMDSCAHRDLVMLRGYEACTLAMKAVGLEPSGPYERKSVVYTEAEPSRIDAPTSGVVKI